MAFKKGISGNPNGRPPNVKMYSETLRALLEANKIELKINVNGDDKIISIKGDGKTLQESIAIVQIMEALGGNHQAISSIIDRIDGKALQKVEQTNINKLDGVKIEFID